MAHTYDTKSVFTGSANPLTANYTCGAGATVLVLKIMVGGTTARSGGAPTFNNVAMVQADTTRNAAEALVELWYILNPPTGTQYQISIPNTVTAKTMYCVVSSYKAAAGKTSALDAAIGYSATATNPQGSITVTLSGDVVVGMAADAANTFAPTSQTGLSLYTSDIGAFGYGAQYLLMTNSTGVQNMLWGFATSAAWAVCLAAFKEVNLPLSKVVSETLNIVDGIKRWLKIARAPAETEQLGDAVTRPMTLRKLLAETEQVSDSLYFARILRRLIAEFERTSDSLSTFLSGTGLALKKVVTETMTVSDSALRTISQLLKKLVAETERMSDYLVRTMAKARLTAETTRVSDASVRTRAIRRLKAETEQLVDALRRTLTLRRLAAETERMADASSKAYVLRRFAAEVERTVDALRRVLTFRRTLAETERTQDTLTVSRTLRKLVAETERVSDALSKLAYTLIKKFVAETERLSDAAVKLLGKARSVAETERVAEFVRRTATWRRLVAETEQTVESARRTVVWRRINAEIIHIVDQSTRVRGLRRVFNEVAAIIDAILTPRRGIDLFMFASDQIAVDEDIDWGLWQTSARCAMFMDSRARSMRVD